ncbi:MAG: sigma 54-interacting transcriptional regulator [Vicinamibacterales bacterium]
MEVYGPDDASRLAHALLYAGDVDGARHLAGRIDVVSSPDSARARAQLVLGLVDKRAGLPETATHWLQRSIATASHSGDMPQEAWARIHLLRLLMERGSHDYVSAMSTSIRSHLATIDDPHLHAYFHDTIAAIEMQLGHMPAAEQHLTLALQFLAEHPNAWLSQTVAVSASCYACISGDLASARSWIAHAHAQHLHTKHSFSTAAIAANAAHVTLLSGRLRDAKHELERNLVRYADYNTVTISTLDDLARLALAEHRLDDCEALLDRLSQLTLDSGYSRLYSARWSTLTRARLHTARRQWHHALLVIDTALAAAQDASDPLLLATLELAAAESLQLQGNARAAAARLHSAHRHLPRASLDAFATLSACTARLLTDSHPALAKTLHERSLHIWTTRGFLLPIAENPDPALATANLMSVSTAAAPLAASAIGLFDHIAASIILSPHPDLSANALLQVARTLGLEATVMTCDTAATDTPMSHGAHSSHHDLSLGSINGLTYSLQLQAPLDSFGAWALARFLTVSEAIKTLHDKRKNDSLSTLSWPDARNDSNGHDSPAGTFIAELDDYLRRIATTDIPVLITGETGTGKEVAARRIHALSSRSQGLFSPFNCSSVPRDLFESQMFGYRRGSFTGATESFPGIIRRSSGGTLFLDEVGDMPADAQPKLLRFLESGEIHGLGDAQPSFADVRVIAATNADLASLVSSGRFREDLFFRLNIVEVHLLPLRQRKLEIPGLATHYLNRYASEYEKGTLTISTEAMDFLISHPWPGNIRQLVSAMRRAAALAERGSIISSKHLSQGMDSKSASSRRSESKDDTHALIRLDQPMHQAVAEIERAQIVLAIKLAGGNLTEAAALLGLSRKGLYLKRSKYGIGESRIDPDRRSQ